MRKYRIALGALVLSLVCHAQLTTDQKLFDFRSLAALYAKRYGPYEWKRDVIGFDAMNLGPWLDRVSSTTNDLDFYQAMVEYVASFKDSHDAYHLPSSFTATLGMSADLYDGKVLIDGINRTQLPAARFPFTTGDELISIDGRSMADLIAEFSKYIMQANDRATRRRALERILTRSQTVMPRAHEIGDNASVVVQRRNGPLETYSIPWSKSGVPITQVGPVPMPQSVPLSKTMAAVKRTLEEAPDYMQPLLELQTAVDPDPSGVLNYGSLAPIYSPPAGLQQRLGKVASDYFISGTFTSSGYTIGLIRIPSYQPADQAAALAQFDAEIAYFNSATDGLIVDEMRNPGGQLCYGESIVTRLIPVNFRPLGYEIRATWEYVQLYYARLDSAKRSGAPGDVIDQYQVLYDALLNAYNSNRGRTDAVPLCSPTFDRAPATDRDGKNIAYTKPIIMLTDELTMSTADSVAAMIQDNQRGPIVGMRTNGAGGSNSLNTTRWPAGVYSEGDTGVTLSLMVRKDPIVTDDYPATRYIENVGVRPDVVIDYMTTDNLLQGGRPFFQAVTDVIVKQIAASKGN